MNRNQKVILSVCSLIVFLMLIFPPYNFIIPNRVTFNLGYGFIFQPPIYQNKYAGSINTGMLLTEWAGVSLIALFFVNIFKNKK